MHALADVVTVGNEGRDSHDVAAIWMIDVVSTTIAVSY